MFLAVKARDNNVCKLNDDQRLQVCSSILNSAYFDDKVLYLMDNEETISSYPCSSWKVHLRHFDNDNAFIASRILEEPAITCVTKSTKGSEDLYFVSRGDEHDNVFVYAQTRKGRIAPLNISTHVRNLYDWEIPVPSSKPVESSESMANESGPSQVSAAHSRTL